MSQLQFCSYIGFWRFLECNDIEKKKRLLTCLSPFLTNHRVDIEVPWLELQSGKVKPWLTGLHKEFETHLSLQMGVLVRVLENYRSSAEKTERPY